MRITKRALYLQSCKQSVIIGKWKCKHCFSRAHFRTAGRPSAHTDGKIILKEIASGKTTKEIAAEKHLSFHTINSHRKIYSANWE